MFRWDLYDSTFILGLWADGGGYWKGDGYCHKEGGQGVQGDDDGDGDEGDDGSNFPFPN